MRSSRRVLLLTVVAVACGALIVGVALVGLRGPADALGELTDRVLPASNALKRVSALSVEAQRLFLDSLTGPPSTRAATVAESQAAGTRGSARWREYKRLAFGSKSELALQRRYDRLNSEVQTAGAVVFGLVDSLDTRAYQDALTHEHEVANQVAATIEQIDASFYRPRINTALTDASGDLDGTRLWILIVFGVTLAGGLVNAIVLFRGAVQDERVFAQSEVVRRRDERRANLETQLQRGLEMEPNEESTFEVIGAALAEVRSEQPVELLVSDSSRAHFRQVLSTDTEGQGPGCPVTSPTECPAASSGQTRIFLSSRRLDACPYLRSREGEPRSAACFPVSIAGVTTAVIHTTGPEHGLPNDEEMTELELVARKAGDRIGYLRVLARTETQARIDVLTGLFNRRSVEQQALDVLERGSPFVVAFADLDHFKDVNDEYGHEMGDRALRLFGRVLRDSVRPSDIPARFGGEEFVVVLPDCNLPDARIVAERVRTRLASAIAIATVPVFTVSIGLAASEPPESFGDTVVRADAALLHAKGAGRDRVVASSDIPQVDAVSGRVAKAPVADG